MKLIHRSQVPCLPCKDPRLGRNGRGYNRTHIQDSDSIIKFKCVVTEVNGPLNNELLELPIIDHLLDDVEATHELSIDNELRERWPVIVDLQA